MRLRVLALVLAVAPAFAQEASSVGDVDPSTLTTSRRDHTDPATRDLPIRCKDGDIEYFPGRSLGEVFGAAWPAAPVATTRRAARAIRVVSPERPNGLGQDGAIAVTAVLVAADGTPVDAKVICATAPAMANEVVRAAMRSQYAPAMFDGQPAVGVATNVWRFSLREASPRRRQR